MKEAIVYTLMGERCGRHAYLDQSNWLGTTTDLSKARFFSKRKLAQHANLVLADLDVVKVKIKVISKNKIRSKA